MIFKHCGISFSNYGNKARLDDRHKHRYTLAGLLSFSSSHGWPWYQKGSSLEQTQVSPGPQHQHFVHQFQRHKKKGETVGQQYGTTYCCLLTFKCKKNDVWRIALISQDSHLAILWKKKSLNCNVNPDSQLFITNVFVFQIVWNTKMKSFYSINWAELRRHWWH